MTDRLGEALEPEPLAPFIVTCCGGQHEAMLWVTDQMIERGARALRESKLWLRETDDDWLVDSTIAARVVLEAAFHD